MRAMLQGYIFLIEPFLVFREVSGFMLVVLPIHAQFVGQEQ